MDLIRNNETRDSLTNNIRLFTTTKITLLEFHHLFIFYFFKVQRAESAIIFFFCYFPRRALITFTSLLRALNTRQSYATTSFVSLRLLKPVQRQFQAFYDTLKSVQFIKLKADYKLDEPTREIYQPFNECLKRLSFVPTAVIPPSVVSTSARNGMVDVAN